VPEVPQEVRIEPACPSCGGALTLTAVDFDLPYFGPALLTTVRCGDCSFRHADTLLTREGEPARYTLRVEGKDDFAARVVRSQSGTIRLRELGAVLEPGAKSESFLTNAEGVLWRFRDIAEGATALAGSKRGAVRVLARLDRMIAGSEPFTLVVEDPTGNSVILSPKAVRRCLSAREATRLKRGAFVVDLSGRA